MIFVDQINRDKNNFLAERSFDLRTSGLWAQHASTAPLCSYYLICFNEIFEYIGHISVGNY